MAQQKTFGRLPKRPLKNCCFTETGHVTSTVDNSSVLVENGLLRTQRWSKYIFVANEYTANVIYYSPQLCIFIEPINARFYTSTCNTQVFTKY